MLHMIVSRSVRIGIFKQGPLPCFKHLFASLSPGSEASPNKAADTSLVNPQILAGIQF